MQIHEKGGEELSGYLKYLVASQEVQSEELPEEQVKHVASHY